MAASRLVTVPKAALFGVALAALAWWAAPAADAPVLVAPAQRIASPAFAPSLLRVGDASADQPSKPSAAPVPPKAEPSALAALLTAPEADLRASLYAALARRDQGGRLYARALARRCADLAGLQLAAQADTNDVRHQRAVTRRAALAAGCGQFGTAEWLTLVNVLNGEAGAEDPLLNLQQSDLDDAPLLQAVSARPDPLLLDELGERLLLRRVDGQALLYFDGQRFETEADRDTAQAALRLLPCHFGLACDERDPEVWLACLRGDGCATSRADTASAAAHALAVRLAEALRGRELHRFLRAARP